MFLWRGELTMTRLGLPARLSEKPWTGESLVRLAASLFICIYAGSLLTAMAHCVKSGAKSGTKCAVIGGAALLCLAGSMALIRRRWRVETLIRQLGVILTLFYAGFLLGVWVQKIAGPAGPSVGQMVIGALSFQGSALVLIVVFMREHGVSWDQAFGFPNHWKHAILIGIIVACVFLPVGFLLQWGSAEVMTHVPRLKLHPVEQESVQTLRMAGSNAQFIVLGVVTILLAPFAEEMLFRGILYPWIKQIGFPRLALWVTSLLFAAVHMNLVTFAPLLLLALLLAQLYERTNNLLAPISAHALFNALNFSLLYIVQRT